VAFTYQSKRGQTWYLHVKEIPLGDAEPHRFHYLAPELNVEEAAESLPEGYVVFDSGRSVRLVTGEQAERYQERMAAEGRGRRRWRRRRAGVDWAALALELGTDFPGGSETGTDVARLALETILGEQNIARAVELRLTFGSGYNVAESVLRHIRSERATDLAYAAYKGSTGERAVQAVALIWEIGHPKALDWIEEFLADDNVARTGIGVLDALLFRHAIDEVDDRVDRLLTVAEHHEIEYVREQAAFIRSYLNARLESDPG
jgi:hypothetical protein